MQKPLLELFTFRDNSTTRSPTSAGTDSNTGSEKLLRSLAENSADLIVYLRTSPKIKVTYVNPASVAITGYKPEEFCADPKLLSAIIHPEDAGAFGNFLKDRFPAVTDSLTVRCIRANGSVAWLETTKTAIANSKGKPAGIMLTARDITLRMEAEAALRESRLLGTSLLEHAPLGTMVINPDTTIRYVNHKWEEITGRTLDEVIGLKAPYPGWTQENIFDLPFPGKEAGTSAGSADSVIVRKDGERCDVTLDWTAIYEEGVLRYTLLYVTDISEKTRMKKALRESEEKFSQVFLTSPDAISITAKGGVYLEINEAHVAFFGYTREEVIGKTPLEIRLWVDMDEHDRFFRKFERNGYVHSEEVRFRAKSGDIRTILLSLESITLGGKICRISVCTDITERKKAEKELADEAARRRILMKQTRDSIVIMDQTGAVYEANPSFARMLGYTMEEVRRLHVWEWDAQIAPEALTSMIDAIDEKGVHFETVHRRKDGSLIDVEISGNAAFFDDRKLIFCVCRDVTERKRAEQALQESEERFFKAFNSSPGAVSILRRCDNSYIEVNERFLQDTGYSREDVIGKTPVDIGFWADSDERDFYTEAVRLDGHIQNEFLKYRTSSGEIKTGYYSVDTVSIGNEPCLIMQTTDITLLKNAESKLRATKDLVESILSSMPEGVLVIGNDDKVLLANDAFYKIFSVRQRSAVDKSLADMLDVEQLNNLYREVRSGNYREKTLEFRYKKKGEEKIIASVMTGMPDGRTLITFSDVSNEREEEAKLYLTDRLASIGEMAAGLAHELNNPLTGILALSQMLLEGEIDNECREDISSIYSEAKRAANIVKNVLLFPRNSRSEYGKSNANAVIRDVLKLREYEARLNDITVVADLENDLPDSHIDQYQLQQVFLNLVLNAEAAIRETGKNGILTVTTRHDANNVKIAIKDNGCGIKKSVLPRIFDPFFTTKDIGKGTGLGLSISYGIVVKHGGRITVDTRINEGTTFTVVLPVYDRNGK